MHIHYFQHVPFEGLACIEDWIKQEGHRLTGTRWYEATADTAPLVDADWLIIMGGPMGVYEADQYPWMAGEITLIREAIQQNKKVLGICLGSQLLAAALGAKVYPHTQIELGIYPIDFTFQDNAAPLIDVLPQHMDTFHFHGDTFDIPANATRFAASSACNNQAFIYGDRVIGLQFHMEVTPDALPGMLDFGKEVIAKGGQFIQSREDILAQQHLLKDNNNTMKRLLQFMAAL
ncbi:type 1 glutamine amidotransferase [Chitinophaga vietnamensis]|uniref:type 1 glutamine amidotransferase n=1 Tax=Chitinophaga vietnamensis TaxID=2593957 RepID=UPI001177C052|nr:gamma-glutamyl-gamma-aminobutyrate hydrolase family protein [Chitinophaga vietnamensis]